MLVLDLPTPAGRMEGWVERGGWLHTEMVYLPASSRPSKYINPTRCRVTSLIGHNALPLYTLRHQGTNPQHCRGSRVGRPARYTALLEWLSEYAVGVYTTSDSALLYSNHAQMHRLHTAGCNVLGHKI